MQFQCWICKPKIDAYKIQKSKREKRKNKRKNIPGEDDWSLFFFAVAWTTKDWYLDDEDDEDDVEEEEE